MSNSKTNVYNSHVLPLLRRMIYLEDLMLNLCVGNRSTIIDSTHLNKEVLLYLPCLQTLTFNIEVYITGVNEINWTNFNNVQYIFYNGKSHQSICYIDQFPRGRRGRSHIYSIPYTLNDLHYISSNFPGGLFMNVHCLSMMNIYYPFEHDFFVKIACSFPLLTNLSVSNDTPQKYKRLNQLNNNDQISSLVEFSNLIKLRISSRCIDYVEQFLEDTNTRLPRLLELKIDYIHLQFVTENFTPPEKQLDEALAKGKNALDNKEVYEENKKADAVEDDLEDLREEIKQVKEEGGIESTEEKSPEPEYLLKQQKYLIFL
ncbi:hypothetical protein I4U23_010968 [Adineta vaga]|nr:hypothetical protein I4U23_010968 [Adineta vaga]